MVGQLGLEWSHSFHKTHTGTKTLALSERKREGEVEYYFYSLASRLAALAWLLTEALAAAATSQPDKKKQLNLSFRRLSTTLII